MKKHPVTGEYVPDETAQVLVLRYINPRKAMWPDADFIVGNPPFVGTARMRAILGDGYTESVRSTYPELPESCDYVMYWWSHAAHLVREGKTQRFGFITTNSLRQAFNRRVLDIHLLDKQPLSLVFAIPDHPWVDTVDGAAVRIAMTVGVAGTHQGILKRVVKEQAHNTLETEVELSDQRGTISSDLTIGANVAGAIQLMSNLTVSSRGCSLHGSGFIVTPEQARDIGLGRIAGLQEHIRYYRNGRDLTQRPRNVMVIDLFSLTDSEVRTRFPEVYQWVYERVKPERDHNNRASYRENWWIFGEPRANFRPALTGLSRYIATVETAKHRFFVFLDASILPDNKLVNIALGDAYFLGVLSSYPHITWTLAAGSRLEDRPVYVKTTCFETFPFPNPTSLQKSRIRSLAESLDAHRKRQQEQYPALTMTDIYNVLEKLRSGEPLNDKERVTHEHGLVSVLRQIHDDLDAAVFDAYGWPVSLTDEEILERLVALNAERVAEERRGIIRWLRPEYQQRGGMTQTDADFDETVTVAASDTKEKKPIWPASLPEQARAVQSALVTLAIPATPEDVAKCFTRARVDRVTELLETLVSLGQSFQVDDGRFVAQGVS